MAAIEFLFFSYFSFSFETLKTEKSEIILQKLIARAYRDAASHVLSIKEGNPRDNQEKEKKPDYLIFTAINDLRKNDDFSTWHNNLCKTLRDCYMTSVLEYKDSINRHFSYGIAQKWINMALKYMAIIRDLCKTLPDSLISAPFNQEYGQLIDSRREEFHVPVDRYIINAAGKQSDNIPLPSKSDENTLNREKHYKTLSDYVLPWSRWDDESVYKNFQIKLSNSIKEDAKYLNPLDWESRSWIDEAEKTNN